MLIVLKFVFLQLIMTVSKWIILAVLNCAFVVQLSRHPRPVLASQQLSLPERSHQTRHINYIVLASALLYFVTQSPNAYCKSLIISGSSQTCSPFYFPLINLLSLSNYSLNFLLYCMVSTKFRQLLRQRRRTSLGSTIHMQLTSLRSNRLPLLRKPSCAKNGPATRQTAINHKERRAFSAV